MTVFLMDFQQSFYHNSILESQPFAQNTFVRSRADNDTVSL